MFLKRSTYTKKQKETLFQIPKLLLYFYIPSLSCTIITTQATCFRKHHNKQTEKQNYSISDFSNNILISAILTSFKINSLYQKSNTII